MYDEGVEIHFRGRQHHIKASAMGEFRGPVGCVRWALEMGTQSNDRDTVSELYRIVLYGIQPRCVPHTCASRVVTRKPPTWEDALIYIRLGASPHPLLWNKNTPLPLQRYVKGMNCCKRIAVTIIGIARFRRALSRDVACLVVDAVLETCGDEMWSEK